MTRGQAAATFECARAAAMKQGDYVAGLVDGVPVLISGLKRGDCLTALIASNAELATLGRSIHRLTSPVREGAARPTQEYRDMLDSLAEIIRGYLSLASGLLVVHCKWVARLGHLGGDAIEQGAGSTRPAPERRRRWGGRVRGIRSRRACR